MANKPKKKPPAPKKAAPVKKKSKPVVSPPSPATPSVSYTEITEAITLMVLRKMSDHMNALQKTALQALATAASALAASAQALAASTDDGNAVVPASKPKAAPPAACAETTTSPEGVTRTCTLKGEHTEHAFPPAPKAAPVVAPKAAPKAAPVVAPKAAPVAAPAEAEPLATQARKAAKSYAEVYGREGLKAILVKYTEGTLADVTEEQLPALIAELAA
jgi:hypothetical protein